MGHPENPISLSATASAHDHTSSAHMGIWEFKKSPSLTSLLKGDFLEGSFKWGNVHFICPFKLAAINFQFYARNLQVTERKGEKM